MNRVIKNKHLYSINWHVIQPLVSFVSQIWNAGLWLTKDQLEQIWTLQFTSSNPYLFACVFVKLVVWSWYHVKSAVFMEIKIIPTYLFLKIQCSAIKALLHFYLHNYNEHRHFFSFKWGTMCLRVKSFQQLSVTFLKIKKYLRVLGLFIWFLDTYWSRNIFNIPPF